MAISVDWANRVVYVPKADMTLIQVTPIEVRELDINTFHLALKALLADSDGMPFLDTHVHVAPQPLASFDIPRSVLLINSYTWTPEDGQYVINVSGGNHNLGSSRNPNQVSVSENLSAGLVQSREIEHASFLDGVTIDSVIGVEGTTYPIGTPVRPVNNLADALLIAQIRGFTKLFVHTNLSVLTGDFSKFLFQAHVRSTVITVGPGAILTGCHFDHCILTGEIASLDVHVRDCTISNLTMRSSRATDCTLSGTLTPNTAPLVITDCIDSNPAGAVPTVDLANMTTGFAMRDYHGRVRLINMTTGVVSIELTGSVEIDASCSGGIISLRGIGTVQNNSTGTTVDTSGFMSLSDPRALTVGKFLGLK